MKELCVIPGCKREGSLRHELRAHIASDVWVGYVCDEHWTQIFRAEEARKVEPFAG